MGKRGFQQKASRALTKIPTKSPSIRKITSVHRGRKKREETKQRLEKKRSFVETELAKIELLQKEKREAIRKKQIKKSVGEALSILPNLADSLPSITNDIGSNLQQQQQQRQQQLKKSIKPKQWSSILEQEKLQMGRVKKHEAFIDMGVDALKAHLSNTVMNSTKPSSSANSKIKRRNVRKQSNNNNNVSSKQQSSLLEDKAIERRAHKKKMAEKAIEMGSKKRADVKKQTLGSLLGGKQKGRIGEKRPKDLD